MGKVSDLLLHPTELLAALQLKFFSSVPYPRDPSTESAETVRCYELLDYTSRSFAAVIQQLHPELRDVITIFYVVLRALDTLEDDLTIPLDVKIPLLRSFDEIVYKDGWTFHDSKEKDRVVLEEFDKVVIVFKTLKPEYQKIIQDTAKLMGNGMADYAINADFNRDGLDTVKDYDLYCYYVAGIVGDALTKMAIVSEFGSPILEKKPELHMAMGLFLQKTNIIRDFREDLDDGRTFYPKEIWKSHVPSLAALKDPKIGGTKGLDLLTDMTINALELVPNVLEYLDNVNEPTLFRFCAIPQIMAICTLELVFQNEDVFQKHVKIRRGLAAKLILLSSSRRGVYDVFREYVQRIHLRNVAKDPNYLKLEILCGKIEQYIEEHYPSANAELGPLKDFKDSKDSKGQAVNSSSLNMYVLVGVSFGAALLTCVLMVGMAWIMGADFSGTLKDGFKWLEDEDASKTVASVVSSTVLAVKDEL